jgi:hypothetical protein
MGSNAMIHVPSFIKTDSGIRKLMERGEFTGTQLGDGLSPVPLSSIFKECVLLCYQKKKYVYIYMLHSTTYFGITGHHQVYKLCLRSRKKKHRNLEDFD